MEKKIEDYLHLYLGSEATVCAGDIDIDGIGLLVKIDTNYGQKTAIVEKGKFCSEVGVEFIKPILRPLSDITKKEKKEMVDTQEKLVIHGYDKPVNLLVDSGETFRYLLSKGFDLFGLIEAGLAIDKTKLDK